MKCDILIIRCPYENFYSSNHRLFPYSLFLLKSFFYSLGLHSCIADFTIGESSIIEFPNAFQHLKSHYSRDLSYTSLYQNYRRFGLSDSSITEFWHYFSQNYTIPKVVFISSSFTAYRNTVLSTVKILRKFFKGAIIVGGIDVIINSDEYEKLFKSCIIYPYKTFNKLLPILSELFFFRNKETENAFFIADLNQNKDKVFSFPSIQLLDNELKILRYYIDKQNYIKEVNASEIYKTASIVFTNGCPHLCSFCYHSAMQDVFYYKHKETIQNELILMHKAGFRSIIIEDDSFFYNYAEATTILQMLAAIQKKYNSQYFFYNGANYHDINGEILILIDKANIKKITVALGSLDNVKKIYKRSADDMSDDTTLDDLMYRSSAMNQVSNQFSILAQATLFRIARCLEFIKKNNITRNSLYRAVFEKEISLADIKLYQKHSANLSRIELTIVIIFFIIKEKIWYRVYKENDYYYFTEVPIDPDVFIKFHEYLSSYYELKNPYFSIILPVYNRLDRLKNTLRSIEKQNERNFELIIVNDNAENEISDFLNNFTFSEDISVTKINNSVNRGVSISRNLGVEASKGNIIVFIDSDDIMDERKLEYCLKVFKENQLVGWLLHDEEWIRKGVVVNKPKSFVFSSLEEFMIKMSERCIIGVGCCIFEKEFLEAYRKKVGYIFNPKYYVSEDYDFFLQVIAYFYYTIVNKKLQKKIGGDTDSLSKIYKNTIKSIRNTIHDSLANNERLSKVLSISINILKRVKWIKK